MTKAELRKLYTDKRNALSAAEYDTLNRQLLAQFKTLDLAKVKCLHIFLPILSRKEPDTNLIIKWLQETHPQIKLVFPKTNFADNSMQSFLKDSNLRLAVNSHGITEPVSGTEVDPKEIDMIILPLLCFDQHGYRVGYGKGFYDRFITQCCENVQLVGLSFFEPVDEISDVNQYDKKMQMCVTAERVWEF